jgi:hypothetical protein
MSNKPCIPDPLVMSEYCRLLICPDCGTLHLNLPSRISLQFDVSQFLSIADAFTRAAQILRSRMESSPNPKRKAKVLDFDRSH